MSDQAARARFEELTSRNMDVDRLQLEMSEVRNEIRRIGASLKERGIDVAAEVAEAVDRLERMSEKTAEKVYGRK